MNTNFLLKNRASFEDLYRHSHYFADRWPLKLFTDAVSEFVCVMNEQRQIVFSNNSLARFLKVEDPDDLIGTKYSDIFQCVVPVKKTGDDDSTECCSLCGMPHASTGTINGESTERECRIIGEPDAAAMELKIRSTPITINNEHFIILAAADISSEKRRKVLESVFFHDVLNVVGGLVGYSELLQDVDGEQLQHFASVINGLSMELTDQIETQRDLSLAEHNEIQTKNEVLHSLTVLRSVEMTYKQHIAAAGKHLIIDERSEDYIFSSDERLLKRIIGNFTKNALEASGADETVRIGCKRKESTVQFWVRNTAVIPREAQSQIFQRSFSTKTTGSGLGTYGSKLFAERYLGGKVFFISNDDDGTVFTVEIPLLITTNQSSGPTMVERFSSPVSFLQLQPVKR
jgi:nitrogen-specific signal transduction histidine kinase